MISTVSDVCARTVLVTSMFPLLSTHYTAAFRLSFTLTVLRRKSVWSDHIRIHACIHCVRVRLEYPLSASVVFSRSVPVYAASFRSFTVTQRR